MFFPPAGRVFCLCSVMNNNPSSQTDKIPAVLAGALDT